MEFKEWQVIHQDCQETFVCLSEFQGKVADTIELAGISELRTQYEIGRVNPSTHLLIFSTSGGGKLFVGEDENAINAGTFTVLPANTDFYMELAEPHWHTCWFLLKDTDTWSSVKDLGFGIFPCRVEGLVHSTLSLLCQQHELPLINSDEVERELMDILAFYLKTALGTINVHSNAENRLLKFAAELPGLLHLNWNTDKMAKELHLSEPHLFRLSKSLLGKSPMQYLAELRLQHSCELLRHSNLTVEQIAQCVGYSDGTSFSHRFRKSLGVSPKSWRTRNLAI